MRKIRAAAPFFDK